MWIQVLCVCVSSEQYYVELVVSRREDEPSQDKLFAFYNEKNRHQSLYSDIWIPFVSQVCLVKAT